MVTAVTYQVLILEMAQNSISIVESQDVNFNYIREGQEPVSQIPFLQTNADP